MLRQSCKLLEIISSIIDRISSNIIIERKVAADTTYLPALRMLHKLETEEGANLKMS